MRDLSFWQLLGIWAAMTLLIAQAAVLALAVGAVLWELWRAI